MLIHLSSWSPVTFAQVTSQRKDKPDSLQQKQRHLPSPKGAMIRSLLFPGWGQWYNGKKLKAGLAFALETGIIARAIYFNEKAKEIQNAPRRAAPLNNDYETYIDQRNGAYWQLLAIVLISMADAYVDAHLAGFDVSPELALGRVDSFLGVLLRLRF